MDLYSEPFDKRRIAAVDDVGCDVLEEEPFAGLHRTDAEPLGLRDGDRIAIRTENAAVELSVKVFDQMAPGVMVVPRLNRLPWQALGTRIRRQDIRKA